MAAILARKSLHALRARQFAISEQAIKGSKSVPSLFSPSTPAIPRASRFVSVLGCVESMMPLHSAIASARLKSSIAVDSTCWSWLSQDFAVPR